MPVARGSVVRRVGFLSATLLGCVLLRWVLCSGFAARAVWFFAFAMAPARRWLLRTRFGFFAFALASAYCLRASSVAPVRGGTYFSLPPPVCVKVVVA